MTDEVEEEEAVGEEEEVVGEECRTAAIKVAVAVAIPRPLTLKATNTTSTNTTNTNTSTTNINTSTTEEEEAEVAAEAISTGPPTGRTLILILRAAVAVAGMAVILLTSMIRSQPSARARARARAEAGETGECPHLAVTVLVPPTTPTPHSCLQTRARVEAVVAGAGVGAEKCHTGIKEAILVPRMGAEKARPHLCIQSRSTRHSTPLTQHRPDSTNINSSSNINNNINNSNTGHKAAAPEQTRPTAPPTTLSCRKTETPMLLLRQVECTTLMPRVRASVFDFR